LRQHGLLRPLRASALSDGALRYLLLTAALLTPRPPTLLVLNEPETSLHPDLSPALARLIASASPHSQIDRRHPHDALISHLAGEKHARAIALGSRSAKPQILRLLDWPSWPSR
jgi:predicted ATPase